MPSSYSLQADAACASALSALHGSGTARLGLAGTDAGAASGVEAKRLEVEVKGLEAAAAVLDGSDGPASRLGAGSEAHAELLDSALLLVVAADDQTTSLELKAVVRPSCSCGRPPDRVPAQLHAVQIVLRMRVWSGQIWSLCAGLLFSVGQAAKHVGCLAPLTSDDVHHTSPATPTKPHSSYTCARSALTASTPSHPAANKHSHLDTRTQAALVLFLEAVAGMYLPLALRRLPHHQWWLSLLNCFSGGIFLAAGG